MANAYVFGRGFATDLPSGVMAFIKSKPDIDVPDTQLLFHAGPLAAAPYLPPFRKAFPDGFSCRAVLLRPESRGHLALAGSNPATPVRINWNFPATDRDKALVRAAFRAMREVGLQMPMRRFIDKELTPGAGKITDQEIDAYIRSTAITAHHPLGTCRMGNSNDKMAVVDEQFRVLGIEQLRVVDASVMPDMIGGNINAAVVMLAEKASDLILGRQILQRAVF